jgi:hypothetical protein
MGDVLLVRGIQRTAYFRRRTSAIQHLIDGLQRASAQWGSHMKTKSVSMIVVPFALVFTGAMGAIAQDMPHGQMKQPKSGKMDMSMMDMSVMMRESHHILAMAYQQNLAAFAKALHEQTAGVAPLNLEFARAAVAEMRRSFDQMGLHHQAHMQTMSAEMHAKMGAMMQQMETDQTELDTQLTALEHEVQSATPDAKRVSALAAAVQTHLDTMSKMHEGMQAGKMKMKM